jgi:membrane fusion protein (multidrug efflux system)
MSQLESNQESKTQGPNSTEAKKMEQEKLSPNPIASRKTSGSSGTKKLVGALVVTLVVVGGSYMGYQSYEYVSTDNAMVQASSTLLSSKISGIISKVNVQENQKVKAGDVLVEIRPEDYQNVLDQTVSEGESLAVQLKGAETNYNRVLNLLKRGASTQERLDTAETTFRSLEQKLKSAQAQLAEAKLNFAYTKIVAPSDGKVGKRSFEVGMLAAAGQPLLGFVEGNERWVVANFKETDMDNIVEGKKAFITVDAISGKDYEGVIESISPATGATFSLLPPDNATGNFTKVVQRVPVRIKLTNLTEHDIDRLQTGLSAEVKIKIR